MKLLNVGCGRRWHPDWTNVDALPNPPHVLGCDIRRGLPFDAEEFDAVYHSHVLEHLTRADGVRLLQECQRVLKRGGVVRIVVPDLGYNAQLYVDALRRASASPQDEVVQEEYEWALLNLIDQCVRIRPGGEMLSFLAKPGLRALDYISNTTGGTEAADIRNAAMAGPTLMSKPRPRALPRRAASWLKRRLVGTEAATLAFLQSGEAHRWMYDRHSLPRLLQQIGLTQARVVAPTESSIPGWTDYHLDTEADGSVYKPHSLFVEAVRA